MSNYKSSTGEEIIINILKNNNIRFEREKTFSDMKKYGNKLRLDFYLPKENVAIEFNGEGHYKRISKFCKTEGEFKKRQEYDRYKISYCLAHNIKLYIIPYWYKDKLKEKEDLFRDNFLARCRWKNDMDWRDFQKKIKRDI